LAYFDSDLPQAITQGGITTTFTLDINGHRTMALTGPTGASTASLTSRHYTDTSDNPAWIVNSPTNLGADISTVRSTPSLAGGLGASITTGLGATTAPWSVPRVENGTAILPLANLHGDVVTNITLPAAQAETTPVTTIGAWSDYTEFGAPRDTTATATVSGFAGYGWLGAKERSTTTESAGLTLMGDRLYNAVTGRFTSPDPEPGGNPNAYTYPLDPINMFDLDGHWGWRPKRGWRAFGRAAWGNKYFRGAVVGLATAAVCWNPLSCIVAGGAIGAAGGYGNWRLNHRRESWKKHVFGGARDGAFSSISGVGRAYAAGRWGRQAYRASHAAKRTRHVKKPMLGWGGLARSLHRRWW
jgi:RHS repeat-associated protein